MQGIDPFHWLQLAMQIIYHQQVLKSRLFISAIKTKKNNFQYITIIKINLFKRKNNLHRQL